jgi:hypothetical protein
MDDSKFIVISLLGLSIGIIFLLLKKRDQQFSRQIVSSFLEAASIPSFRNSIGHINKELSRARRSQSPLSIILIEHHPTESGFKNELHSNQLESPKVISRGKETDITDFLLSGKVIREVLRDIDIISYSAARQQYLVVLPESTKLKAENAMARIKKVVGKKTADQFITKIAEFPVDGLILDDLMAHATNSISSKDTVTRLDRQIDHQ